MEANDRPRKKHLTLRPVTDAELRSVAGGLVRTCGFKGDECGRLVVIVKATEEPVILTVSV